MEEQTNPIKTVDDRINEIKSDLLRIDNKEFSFYFFTIDTLGNPVASVANIYEHVKVLNELGYKAAILHEKNDYRRLGNEETMGINEWLGEEYAELPHISIEAQTLTVGPTDFIIIPEAFPNIMDQVKTFPCKKVVFSQSYDYLLELLPIGKKWNNDYGFNDVITTTEKQGNYIKSLFHGINTHVVPVAISDIFKPSEKPKEPVVTIVTRNHGDAKAIANSFYLQYPIYKFITFKELRGITREQFADELGKSCLSVWIDNPSGFGTFPLEAMQSGTPVIGKIPNMIPEWMEEVGEDGEITLKNNGVWTNTTLNIPELIATYMKVWFEDSVPQDLFDSMDKTNGSYSTDKQKIEIEKVYSTLVANRRSEIEATTPNKEELNA